jgi:hypothetical protein
LERYYRRAGATIWRIELQLPYGPKLPVKNSDVGCNFAQHVRAVESTNVRKNRLGCGHKSAERQVGSDELDSAHYIPAGRHFDDNALCSGPIGLARDSAARRAPEEHYAHSAAISTHVLSINAHATRRVPLDTVTVAK